MATTAKMAKDLQKTPKFKIDEITGSQKQVQHSVAAIECPRRDSSGRPATDVEAARLRIGTSRRSTRRNETGYSTHQASLDHRRRRIQLTRPSTRFGSFCGRPFSWCKLSCNRDGQPNKHVSSRRGFNRSLAAANDRQLFLTDGAVRTGTVVASGPRGGALSPRCSVDCSPAMTMRLRATPPRHHVPAIGGDSRVRLRAHNIVC